MAKCSASDRLQRSIRTFFKAVDPIKKTRLELEESADSDSESEFTPSSSISPSSSSDTEPSGSALWPVWVGPSRDHQEVEFPMSGNNFLQGGNANYKSESIKQELLYGLADEVETSCLGS